MPSRSEPGAVARPYAARPYSGAAHSLATARPSRGAANGPPVRVLGSARTIPARNRLTHGRPVCRDSGAGRPCGRGRAPPFRAVMGGRWRPPRDGPETESPAIAWLVAWAQPFEWLRSRRNGHVQGGMAASKVENGHVHAKETAVSEPWPCPCATPSTAFRIKRESGFLDQKGEGGFSDRLRLFGSKRGGRLFRPSAAF